MITTRLAFVAATIFLAIQIKADADPITFAIESRDSDTIYATNQNLASGGNNYLYGSPVYYPRDGTVGYANSDTTTSGVETKAETFDTTFAFQIRYYPAGSTIPQYDGSAFQNQSLAGLPGLDITAHVVGFYKQFSGPMIASNDQNWGGFTTSTITSVSLDPSASLASLPPSLLEILQHPELISLNSPVSYNEFSSPPVYLSITPFSVPSVPEPTTLIVFLVGGGAGILHRRRKIAGSRDNLLSGSRSDERPAESIRS